MVVGDYLATRPGYPPGGSPEAEEAQVRFMVDFYREIGADVITYNRHPAREFPGRFPRRGGDVRDWGSNLWETEVTERPTPCVEEGAAGVHLSSLARGAKYRAIMRARTSLPRSLAWGASRWNQLRGLPEPSR